MHKQIHKQIHELFNKQLFRQICFLLNVFFIISTEFAVYCIFRNYSNFIDRITQRLASINILYVKIFQAIALNNSLIDDKINNKLLQFTDNAPWSYNDINYDELIELTDEYNINLYNGFEKPINSGMISLVFKGYKREGGKNIVIKMKRKNIENKLNESIDNLFFIVNLLSLIPSIQKYQFYEIINKNIAIIKQQVNFAEEVQNMIKIKTNCKTLKYVSIPDVYAEITEKYPNFIVMEYIDGLKINEVKEEDYIKFAEQVVKFGFVTLAIHGVIHGDLHAGNILFIKNENDNKCKYKIGVIDFGIIYELNDTFKETCYNIMSNLFVSSPRETAEKILNSSLIDPPGILQQIPKKHYENIIICTSDIINESINNSSKGNQLQLYKFLYKLNDYLNNPEIASIGIRPSDNFVKSQLVLAMAHGVTLTLCKNDFFSLADKVINSLFHTDLLAE